MCLGNSASSSCINDEKFVQQLPSKSALSLLAFLKRHSKNNIFSALGSCPPFLKCSCCCVPHVSNALVQGIVLQAHTLCIVIVGNLCTRQDDLWEICFFEIFSCERRGARGSWLIFFISDLLLTVGFMLEH